MDINKLIFSRTTPKKKEEAVKIITFTELTTITSETILHMVKEAGTRLFKSRDKQLRLNNPVSNDWNAEIKSLRTTKGNLSLDIYLQYENTDTNTSVGLDSFLKPGNYKGSVIRNDRHGKPRSYYFTFTEHQKGEFLRALLLTYFHTKYNDKQ